MKANKQSLPPPPPIRIIREPTMFETWYQLFQTIKNMTLLKFINVFFLQWFFVRLTICTQKEVTNFELTGVSIGPNGISTSGKVNAYRTKQWMSLMYFVVPCTGWWKPFVGVGKIKYLKLSNPEYID